MQPADRDPSMSRSSSALSYLTVPLPETSRRASSVAVSDNAEGEGVRHEEDVAAETTDEDVPPPPATATEPSTSPRQTWLTTTSTGLQALTNLTKTLQIEQQECKRVQDTRHAECVARHAAKAARLRDMQGELGDTLHDAERAAEHRRERAHDGERHRGEEREERLLHELTALRREKWVSVRDFFEERRAAQDASHNELLAAINSARGGARRV